MTAPTPPLTDEQAGTGTQDEGCICLSALDHGLFPPRDGHFADCPEHEQGEEGGR